MSVLPVGIGSAEAGGYQIERSLRFNSADSANLTRTPSTNGNRKTWTWSGWIKRANPSQAGTFWGSNFASGGFGMAFGNYGGAGVEANRIGITLYAVGTVTTNAVFRDPSAWSHIVARFDSTQADQANRFRLYFNGVQQTLSANLNVTQNADYHINESGRLHVIGGESGYYNDFYMAEIHHVDGSSLDPTSFGEYNETTGVWQPKAYTGSYGTNGFYLNFSDNSGTTSTTLGKDSSGNGNNWTPNNFSVTAGVGNDSLVDSPTNYGTDTGVGGEVRGNYATLNPLAKGSIIALANGNLDASSSGTSYSQCLGTIGMSSGKWYWEVTVSSVTGTSLGIGIAKDTTNLASYGGDIGSFVYINDGGKGGNNSFSGYGNSFTTNDVIGVAFDADAGEIKFYKNNTVQNSGTPAFTGLTAGPYLPVVADQSIGAGNNWSIVTNFGQRPFAYPLSGFKALCTQNLPEPTIVDGGQYFNTVLYTGTGATRTVTGVGFQPDFTWIKSRSNTYFHRLYDAVRGATKALYSNDTLAEETKTGELTSFDSDGFSLGGDTGANGSGATFAAWNWKANGAGVSNTAGTITSTVSANTDSGFSIVTYTGTGANATVGHGLGVAPSMVINKNRSAVDDWSVYTSTTGTGNKLLLNSTAASGSTSNYPTAPDSSVFYVGAGVEVNGSGNEMVAYCFAAIPGYSAFGSYTGNGSTDGPFVFLGFRARYILRKRTDTAGASWRVIDTARDTYNLATAILEPNTSDATETNNAIDILSNGIKMRSTDTDGNASGGTYIYMAFAENPFKYALAR